MNGKATPRQMLLVSILSIVLLVGVYNYLSYRQHQVNEFDTTIPTFSQLVDGVERIAKVDDRGERWLAIDTAASAIRYFTGLFLGAIGAFFLGVMMGRNKYIEAFLLPPLSLLAKIPPTAALAVFFVMVGTGTEMFVAMIAFGVLPTLAQTVYLGVKEVPAELIDKSYTLGASNSEIIWSVIVPQVLPKVIDSIRLQIGPAMVYLIAAEMVVSSEGLGYRIRVQSKLSNMHITYWYLLLLAVSGYAMDYIMIYARRIVSPWYLSERR
jgi:NitT/TauT family transport system permease protein